MSEFKTKKIWFLPNFEWNKKTVQFKNFGKCPCCGCEQNFDIHEDDSLKIKGSKLTALVSCYSPLCGRQIRLSVVRGVVHVCKKEG